ncbi:hypothetical protein ACFL4B_03030 [Candidatus Neomarinimicrobiota bacterium]
MNTFHRVILIIPLLLLYTCEDNDQKYFDLLFEATFSNNFAADTIESFLVIQDTLGNVLADTSWSGDTHFKLYSSKNGDVPEYISVTFITKGPSENATLHTYYKIPSKSHWIWDDINIEDKFVGKINLSFINIPSHSDASLSVKGWHPYLHQIVEGQTYSVKTLSEESDILLMLKTDNGAIYKWITDIPVGSNMEVDLSSYQVANEVTIPNTNKCTSYLDGYFNTSTHHLTKAYRLITNSFDNYQDDDIKVYYPNNVTSFHLRITYYEVEYEDPLWHNTWYQRTFGELPLEFVMIDANAEIMNSDIDDLVIYRNGSFDQYDLYFTDAKRNTWIISMNPSIGSTKLPQLPTSVYDTYTELDRSNFNLSEITLLDYVGINSQEELIDILFKTDNVYIYDIISTLYIRTVPNDD